uniref:Mitochondrial 2-oxodicarboxylate carrier n=1 Tax=Globodera rostochiensis TaxID=31243 RepID=A0A914HAJ2_GLORO
MERLKEGGRQFVAGGTAGMVEVCLMHPLDLMKTRLQVGGSRYAGLADCFRQTLRKEGVSGFYKGILPPIIAETPKRATKFFTFEQYKRALEPLAHQCHCPAWACLSLAGLLSGLTEAIVICPFEVVKVRLQTELNVSLAEQRSSAAVAREITRANGIGTSGLYRGLGATLWRHGVWNMFYFGLYHNLRTFMTTLKTNREGNQSPQGISVPLRLFLGFLAGSVASVANIPFDVAKSRIQGPQPESGRVYHTTWQTVRLVYRREGFTALYRGLVPKVMRLGPGGGIMLVVFETVYEFLAKHT